MVHVATGGNVDSFPYTIRPRPWGWAAWCAFFAALDVLGVVLVFHGDFALGLVAVLLGSGIGYWSFVYARPITLVLGESDLEFRALRRQVRVPYEQVYRVSLMRSDDSLLDLFTFGLRLEGSFSSLLAWYLFVAWFPTVAFIAAIWTINGWTEMIGSSRFWLIAWVPGWTVLFLAVRFLVVPAMRSVRLKSACLTFKVDPQLLTRQPFTYFKSRPIVYPIAPFSVLRRFDLERLTRTLEGKFDRFPPGALARPLIHELQIYYAPADPAAA